MSVIRILHMIGSLNMGGSQAMVMNFYRTIDKKKVQFDFIIDYPSETYFKDEILSMGGRIYTFPVFDGKNYLEIKKTWSNFFAKHKEYRILHSHVRSYASLYFPIAKKYGVKTIIHSHSTSSGTGIKSIIKKILQYPLRFQADYLFACSRESGEWLYGDRVVSNNNFYVLPNAIACDRYKYNPIVRERVRKTLGFSENELIIGHVGRFSKPKNHDFILEIFSKVQNDKNAKLLLVGDGELRKEVEKRISRLGLEDKVVLLGQRNDVPDLMQAMDVFVFPSKWEGLPVTIVEAQAAGLPCYISNVITKEVCLSDLVEFLSLDCLTDWCDAILKNNPIRKHTNVCDEIADAGYDIKKAAKWIEKFYLSIIGGQQ